MSVPVGLLVKVAGWLVVGVGEGYVVGARVEVPLGVTLGVSVGVLVGMPVDV